MAALAWHAVLAAVQAAVRLAGAGYDMQGGGQLSRRRGAGIDWLLGCQHKLWALLHRTPACCHACITLLLHYPRLPISAFAMLGFEHCIAVSLSRPARCCRAAFAALPAAAFECLYIQVACIY